jgi:hypothetical protein
MKTIYFLMILAFTSCVGANANKIDEEQKKEQEYQAILNNAKLTQIASIQAQNEASDATSTLIDKAASKIVELKSELKELKDENKRLKFAIGDTTAISFSIKSAN